MLRQGIWLAAWLAAVLASSSSQLWAHGGVRHSQPATTFGLEAEISAVLLSVVVLIYALGAARVAKTAPRQLAAFAAAVCLLISALVWPLDGMADQSLAAHMVQHMIILVAAPPLLIAAKPLATFLRAFPRAGRLRLARLLAVPLSDSRASVLLSSVTVAQAAVMTLWHVPWLYDLALYQPLVHVLEHTTMIASAVWFWWLVSRASTGDGPARALTMVFLTLVHMGMLGGLLTFARQPLYTAYANLPYTTAADLLAAQQLAGLIMWIPAGFVYIGAGLWLLLRLLGPDDDPIDAR